MGQANVITLSPTFTFTEKKKKTESTEIRVEGDYTPSFSPGLSVFSEVDIPKWQFWRKERKLIILFEGAAKAFELTAKKIEPNYWTLKEKQKFTAKTVAKSKAEQKPMTNTQFFVLALISGITLAFTVFMAYKFGVF